MSNPAMKALLVLAAAIILTGCVRSVDHPIYPTCAWIEEDDRSLDLAKFSNRRHLRFDAETAEDVSIRWADQRFHLLPEWGPRQNECMETLFQGVAKQHGVNVATVRQYSRKRDVVVDAAVVLSFGVVYAVAAYILAGRIRRRFPPDEHGFWVMTVAMAIGLGLVGVMLGGLWSIVVEEFRIGSGHLSYRMDLIPVRQHWAVMWVCWFMVFMLAGLVRFRTTQPPVVYTQGPRL